MTEGRSISWRWFLTGMGGMFVLLFALNRMIYITPDSVSMAVGGVIGAYLFAGAAWLVTKLAMRARTPEYKFFVTVVAALSVGLQGYQLISQIAG